MGVHVMVITAWFLFHGEASISVTTQEFNSLSSCVSAKKIIQTTAGNINRSVNCVKK